MKDCEFGTGLDGAKQNGTGWTARCPAHDDSHASLAVAAGDDGRVLIKCHAGCNLDAIVRALGLSTRDLFPANETINGTMNGQGTDWPTIAKQFVAALTPERRNELAHNLDLPESALASLAIGWSNGEGCWTFPESDGQARISGINRR